MVNIMSEVAKDVSKKKLMLFFITSAGSFFVAFVLLKYRYMHVSIGVNMISLINYEITY